MTARGGRRARQHAWLGPVANDLGCDHDLADALVEGGVRSILNFAPAVLRVPPTVHVRAVDLAAELAILAFHEHQQALSTADGEDVG